MSLSRRTHLPSAGEDIDLITRAFVEARYSCREIDFQEADFVRRTWAHLRRALQDRSRSEPFGRK